MPFEFPSFAMHSVPSWQKTRDLKRAEQERSLAGFSDLRLKQTVPNDQADVSSVMLSELSARELEIVHHDATALVDFLRARRYTAVEVAKAHFHAAVVAHDLTNCLSEIFLEEGLERAAELDRHLEETGEVFGPLHGVPCSIKNHIRIRGQDTSSGYIGWVSKTVSEHDAVVVEALRKAGAILYVKTANPQTMMVSRNLQANSPSVI
jgi:amidase